jgi:hypothetical protein
MSKNLSDLQRDNPSSRITALIGSGHSAGMQNKIDNLVSLSAQTPNSATTAISARSVLDAAQIGR